MCIRLASFVMSQEERNAHVREIRELFLAVDMDSNGVPYDIIIVHVCRC